MTRLLLKNGEVLLPDGNVIQADITIKGHLIESIGQSSVEGQVDRVIDCSGKLAVAGFVNTHTHAAMTLFRSYADDMLLMDWLKKKIWPAEAKLTGEDVYWAAQTGTVDPEEALENHMQVNKPDANGHLFAWRHRQGTRVLTKKDPLRRMDEVAASLGEIPMKGHGLRIGATLEYLLRGVPFDVVKSIGRWSGDSFKLYLRKHAVIMAPYLQDSPVLDEITRYTMPPQPPRR